MKTTKIEPHQSSLGMDANIASLIIFVAMAVVSWIPYLGWVAWAVPIVFFILEKKSAFVKFQAATALVISIVRVVLSILFSIIIGIVTASFSITFNFGAALAIIGFLGFISMLIGLAITGLIIYLIIMAYGYKQVELPIIGPIAAKAAEALGKINVNQSGGGNNDSSNQNNG